VVYCRATTKSTAADNALIVIFMLSWESMPTGVLESPRSIYQGNRVFPAVASILQRDAAPHLFALGRINNAPTCEFADSNVGFGALAQAKSATPMVNLLRR